MNVERLAAIVFLGRHLIHFLAGHPGKCLRIRHTNLLWEREGDSIQFFCLGTLCNAAAELPFLFGLAETRFVLNCNSATLLEMEPKLKGVPQST